MRNRYSPEARESEYKLPDYETFCVVRDAALGLKERVPVICDASSTSYEEDFMAVQISTSLEDPMYAPLCHLMRVAWKGYGGKGEELLIELSETDIDSTADTPNFYNRFRIVVAGPTITSTDNNRIYQKCPEAPGGEHETVTDIGHLWQISEGERAMPTTLLRQDFRRNYVSRGDCKLMVSEINRIFPKQPMA